MWPKGIAQLIELLPHLTRLLPMADRFLQSKAAGDQAQSAAQTAALTAMTEGLKGDLGQVAQMHSGLYRQLQEQSAKIDTLSSDARLTIATVDATNQRITRLEAEVEALSWWIKIGLGAVIVLLVAVLILVFQLFRR